jgi:lipoic acid synthetase/lipoyl(octanoyl) transferase
MGEVTIAMFEQLGVDGVEFRMDHPGVWRGESKMASVGLHISRGVTVQGMSINLDVAP